MASLVRYVANMLIIFGSPRSGTTLLAATLNKHSRITIRRESDFLVPAAFVIDRMQSPQIGRSLLKQMIPNTSYYPTSLGQFLSADEISAIVDRTPYQFADLAVAIYAELAARAGKTIAGDKSPNDLMFIRMLDQMGLLAHPAVRIIHLVRDVRDVMLSLREVNWVPSGIEDYFPRIWCDSNLYLQEAARRHAARYHFLRYEDLVRAPAERIEEVCRFLGLAFEPEILDPDDRDVDYKQMTHHANLARPFLAARAFVWQQGIDSDLRRSCEEQASEGLRRFDYPFDS
jgi:Sulfotransferase family